MRIDNIFDLFDIKNDAAISDLMQRRKISKQNGIIINNELSERHLAVYLRGPGQGGEQSMHKHTHYEIVCVMQGHCLYETTGGTSEIQSSTIIFNSNIRSHTLKNESSDFKALVTAFTPAIAEKTLSAPYENTNQENPNILEPFFRNDETYKNILRLEEKPFTRVLILFFQLAHVYNHSGDAPGDTTILLHKLFNSALAAASYEYTLAAPKTAASLLSVKSRALQKIVLYIEDNYEKDISLDELARTANTSKYTLSKAFPKLTGIGLFDYINRRRIEKAKFLLQTSSLNITAVSIQTGFNSVSYFNLAFKKNTGVSPGEYRGKAGKPGS